MHRPRKVYIFFTMDVELLPREITRNDPDLDRKLGRISVLSYARAAENTGYKVTYFFVPYLLDFYKDLLPELIGRGHTAGMHFHVTIRGVLPVPPQGEGLAKYDYNTQLNFIRHAKKVFIGKTGIRPTTFRAGFFSANTDTFRVLIGEGFVSGSTSYPGRYIKNVRALWHGANRCIHPVTGKGIIKEPPPDGKYFTEIPVTAYLNILGFRAKYGDIRIEKLDESRRKYIGKACRQVLRYQIKRKCKYLHLCFFTHNRGLFTPEDSEESLPDFSDGFRMLVDETEKVLEDMNLEGVPAVMPFDYYGEPEP